MIPIVGRYPVILPVHNFNYLKARTMPTQIVRWQSDAYKVIHSHDDEFLIQCVQNNSCIGLTESDGFTLNGKPMEFYAELPEAFQKLAESMAYDKGHSGGMDEVNMILRSLVSDFQEAIDEYDSMKDEAE